MASLADLWSANVSPQHSDQLWSQLTGGGAPRPDGSSIPSKDTLGLHSTPQSAAFQAASSQPTADGGNSFTVTAVGGLPPPPLDAVSINGTGVPCLPVSANTIAPLNAGPAQSGSQPTAIFMQLVGYLPDGRPMFVPSTPGPMPAMVVPPSATSAVQVLGVPEPNKVGDEPKLTPNHRAAVTSIGLKQAPITASVTVIGAGSPAPVAAPIAVNALKGNRPAPLNSAQPFSPSASAQAAKTPSALSVRVGVTAAESQTPAVSVVVGQLPSKGITTPSVVVGQRSAAAQSAAGAPTAQQGVSIRVGSTPSNPVTPQATTPMVAVRVGVQNSNLTSAVASMPLSRKPDAHTPDSPNSGSPRLPNDPVAPQASTLVNSVVGQRPPALASPTSVLVQRAVLDGMTPTLTPTAARRGRSSQLPTPLGALQSPSVRVGLPLATPTSVTVGARPTPTAALSMTVGGVPVPSLPAPTQQQPTIRVGDESTCDNGARESDAWASVAATTVHPPLTLSVGRLTIPLTNHKLSPQEVGMRDHHRRRDGSNMTPHRSASEVCSPQLAPEGTPPQHGHGSRSSSTTASTVSSLPWKPAYKTRLCRSWRDGNSCKYGSKCLFAHGEGELVVAKEAAPMTCEGHSRGSSHSDSSVGRRYVAVPASSTH